MVLENPGIDQVVMLPLPKRATCLPCEIGRVDGHSSNKNGEILRFAQNDRSMQNDSSMGGREG